MIWLATKKTMDNKTMVETLPNFTKEQILKSNIVEHSKDVLNILLDDSKTYTLDEVNDLVNKFKKKKVK